MAEDKKANTDAAVSGRLFDEGSGEAAAYPDWSGTRPNTIRVNIDLTGELLDRLDAEASKIGVPRQSLMKVWLAERLGMWG